MAAGKGLLAERQLFCLRLLQYFKNQTGSIRCRICLKNIFAVHKNQSRVVLISKQAINHALFHLKKPLYRCKLCLQTAATYAAVHWHFQRIHKITTTQGNYDDLSDDFHSEILDVLSKCYDASVE